MLGLLAGRVNLRRGKNFNVAIFLGIINVMYIKLCMMALLIELYPFKPLSVTLIVFQGHSSVKEFQLKFYVLVRLN